MDLASINNLYGSQWYKANVITDGYEYVLIA